MSKDPQRKLPKQQPPDDESTPRGASFDTPEGRAAQGMKPHFGPDAPENDDKPEDKSQDVKPVKTPDQQK